MFTLPRLQIEIYLPLLDFFVLMKLHVPDHGPARDPATFERMHLVFRPCTINNYQILGKLFLNYNKIFKMGITV